MANADDVQAAVDKFNEYELKGRTIVVNKAAPKAKKTLFMG